MRRPLAALPAFFPLSSMIGRTLNPGCVEASITRGSATSGMGESGLIVYSPFPVPLYPASD